MTETMRAYWMDAGDHDVVVEYIAEWPRYERERVCDIVLAPTRGKARSIFINRYRRIGGGHVYLEWTYPIRMIQLDKNVDGEPGFLSRKHPDYGRLWEAVAKIEGDL